MADETTPDPAEPIVATAEEMQILASAIDRTRALANTWSAAYSASIKFRHEFENNPRYQLIDPAKNYTLEPGLVVTGDELIDVYRTALVVIRFYETINPEFGGTADFAGRKPGASVTKIATLGAFA